MRVQRTLLGRLLGPLCDRRNASARRDDGRAPIRLSALAIPFALCVGAFPAAALPPHLEGLPANTWVKLNPTPGRHFHAASTTTWVDCSTSSMLSGPIGRGYSGPVFGNGKIFYFGGAHNSHPGNDADVYDVNANVWTQSYPPEGGSSPGQCLPTCTDQANNPSGCAGACTDPRERDVCDIKNGGAATMVLTPAGRPYVEQTYQQHVWDPIRRQFINGLRSGLWGFDPGSNEWQWHYGCGDVPGDGSDGQCGTADDCRLNNPYDETCANPTLPNQPPSILGARLLLYDPDLQTIIWNTGNRTYKYDYTTKVWTELANTPGIGAGERLGAYNPDGHYFLIHRPRDDQTPHMFKFDAVNEQWRGLDPPAALGVGGPRCWPSAAAYDRVNQVFLLLKSSGCDRNSPVEVWEYDPGAFEDEGSWQHLSFAGPAPNGVARWQPLWYDQQTGFFFFVNSRNNGPKGGFREGDVETWVFRYDRAGAPRTSPAPTGTSTSPPPPTATMPAGTPPTPEPFDYGVTSGGNRSTSPGRSTTNPVATTLLSGYPEPVSFLVSGLPTGATGTFSLGSCDPSCQSLLTISTLASTPAGTFSVTVRAQTPGLPDRTSVFELTVTSKPPPAPLSIPLTIAELLPADDVGGFPPANVVGRARIQEPVTSGIPLKDSDGVADVSELAVFDTTLGTHIPAQFRVLRRHPSGNIQWLLVDFLTDVAANESKTSLRLTGGANPGGSSLGQDQGTTIALDTGPAQFSIRKSNQNVLDQVTVNGAALVVGGNQGGVIYIDGSGVTYTSTNDGTSTAVLEENGPVRAVVKQQGRLVSSSGARSLGYTSRLSFYKGKTFVKVQVSIENAFEDSVTRKSIELIEVRIPVSVGGSRVFELARQTDTVSGSLTSGQTAYLFQGETTHKQHSEDVRIPGRLTFFREERDWGAHFAGSGQDGFTIVHNGTTLHPFQGTSEYSRGFADLRDASGRGLSAAMRDFDSFFPSGIELGGDGEVAVEIWSKRNAQTVTFNWEAHDSRDILLDFHSAAGDPELTHYRVQYPLFARAPYEQYRDSLGLLGRSRLVTFDEMVAYHAQNDAGLGFNQFATANPNFGISEYTLPNQQIVRTRSYNWSEGGRQTNNDYSAAKILSYLHTGHGGLFQTAYNFARFIGDQAVRHSDRADRTTWPVNIRNGRSGPTGTYGVGRTASQFELDMEHENVLGFPLMYFLTGEELIREAFVDHGEWLLREGAFSINCRPGGRGVSQRAKWHSVLWDLTGDGRYKAELDKLVDSALCATIADPSDTSDRGQDRDRGYVYRLGSPRVAATGAGMQVRMESYAEALRVLSDSDPRREELADRLLGIAYWLAIEAFFDRNGDVCPALSDPPEFSSYELDLTPADESTRIRGNMYDQTAVLGHGYRMSKDPWFLYVGQRIVGAFGSFGGAACTDIKPVRQFYAPYSGFYAQDFIYTDLHKSEFDVVFMNDDPGTVGGLTVVNDGAGSYTLSWTVPVGAVSYQIKYGPQPMVPNLNFDKYGRTYQYDPAQYDNFWSGNGEGVSDQPRNVPNEPAPGAPGSQQTFTISGLDPGQSFRFAAKVYTGEPAVPQPTPGRPSAPRLL